MRYYGVFDEFIEDMDTLFNNWIKFRGEGKFYLLIKVTIEHKMFKYCDAVQKRFDKFVEKSKMKTNNE